MSSTYTSETTARLARVTGSAPGALLGIETSCDETAAAVVEGGRVVRSSVVASQVDLHARFGGVVPEIAGRAHVDLLGPVVEEALEQAGVSAMALGGIAATVGPGLVGALLVGASFAKALALAWGLPFVGVNHLEGHLYAAILDQADLQLPMITLLVSGGHTMLVLVEELGSYRMLGQTLDDAAGEAFDKVARFIGLGYPGGPAIDRISAQGDPRAIAFPRPMIDEGYDFSFSGLKTAVTRYVRNQPQISVPDVAASFQQAVVDVCIRKALRAARELGAPTLCLAGGVAANSLLRRTAQAKGEAAGLTVLLPSRANCTDNAAMIAACGWWRLAGDGPTALDIPVQPNMSLAGFRPSSTRG
jgi:N6-L-threonylcarbamoyladenine synthase